jgi:hypothetical protein
MLKINQKLVLKAIEVKNKTTIVDDRSEKGWVWVISKDRKTSLQVHPKNLQDKLNNGFIIINKHTE